MLTKDTSLNSCKMTAPIPGVAFAVGSLILVTCFNACGTSVPNTATGGACVTSTSHFMSRGSPHAPFANIIRPQLSAQCPFGYPASWPWTAQLGNSRLRSCRLDTKVWLPHLGHRGFRQHPHTRSALPYRLANDAACGHD